MKSYVCHLLKQTRNEIKPNWHTSNLGLRCYHCAIFSIPEYQMTEIISVLIKIGVCGEFINSSIQVDRWFSVGKRSPVQILLADIRVGRCSIRLLQSSQLICIRLHREVETSAAWGRMGPMLLQVLAVGNFFPTNCQETSALRMNDGHRSRVSALWKQVGGSINCDRRRWPKGILFWRTKKF